MLTQILLTRVELSMKECKDNLFNQYVCAYTTKEEIYDSVETTNKMQPCNRIYYTTVH